MTRSALGFLGKSELLELGLRDLLALRKADLVSRSPDPKLAHQWSD